MFGPVFADFLISLEISKSYPWTKIANLAGSDRSAPHVKPHFRFYSGKMISLSLNGAGPNPTYSVRGGQIWPLLKIQLPDTQKWSKSGFFDLFHTKSILKQLLLSWICRRLTLCLYLPYIEWPCEGGQILPLLKIKLSDTQKWSKKCFFSPRSKTKVARNLILSDFDQKNPFQDENWRFGDGGQIWPPSHGMCCPNQKVPKSWWRRGLWGYPQNKSCLE